MLKRGIGIVALFLVSALPLRAEPEPRLVHRWTFDSSYLKKFSKIKNPELSSLEAVEGNILKFTQHSSSLYGTGVYGDAVDVRLPRFFILRANVVGQKVRQGHFVIRLGSATAQGSCLWVMNLPREIPGPAAVDLLCQAPLDTKFARIYLDTSAPAVEGEILIQNIEVLEPASPPAYPEVSTYQILRNPGFEETWQYPGSYNTSWCFAGENDSFFHLSDKSQAARGQRLIKIRKGQLRQLGIRVSFPYRYLVTFFAKGAKDLEVTVRESSGGHVCLLRERAEQESAGTGQWRRFRLEYPVLQENTKEVYISFSGNDFHLDEVEMYPVCANPERLKKPIDEARKELEMLLTQNAGKFQEGTREFQKLTENLESGRLTPDEYLRCLEELIRKIKLALIFE